jgi:Uma2 family endonuclease
MGRSLTITSMTITYNRTIQERQGNSMLQIDLKRLPTSAELLSSDDTPVDNEDQNLLPNILLFLLNTIWPERTDWYFGVDMGVYHETGGKPRVPVVPDGFLSLGVEHTKQGQSRRSYVVWEEGGIVPILTLEIVSQEPGREYTDKLEIYQRLGVLYYVIFNPEFWQRDQHQPFELYKLIDGQYQLQGGEPYWMPEVGLGIGRCQQVFRLRLREQLAWFDAKGDRYLTAEERAKAERQRAETAHQRAETAHQRAEVESQRAEVESQRAEAERQQAEAERQRAEAERQRAEAERQRAEAERQRAEAERQRAERLEAVLRSQGLDPNHWLDP